MLNKNVYILGINSAYHEPSACVIKNGKIIAAVEEERFNRVRHGKNANLLNPHQIPEKSIEYCLKQARLEATTPVPSQGHAQVPRVSECHTATCRLDSHAMLLSQEVR